MSIHKEDDKWVNKYNDGPIKGLERSLNRESDLATAAVSAYRESLRKKVEEERDGYIKKRNGWQYKSPNYEAYDLAVRIHLKFLKILGSPETTQL